MPILETPFTCPNGHSFTANAKLRATCPDCGAMARKSFTPKTEKKPEPVIAKKDVTQGRKTGTAVLLRRGRPRMALKPKEEPVVPKRSVASKTKTTRKVIASSKAKVTKSTGPRVAAGIVKTHRLKGTVTPRVNRPPKRTAIARHIAQPTSFFDSVIQRYGPGR